MAAAQTGTLHHFRSWLLGNPVGQLAFRLGVATGFITATTSTAINIGLVDRQSVVQNVHDLNEVIASDTSKTLGVGKTLGQTAGRTIPGLSGYAGFASQAAIFPQKLMMQSVQWVGQKAEEQIATFLDYDTTAAFEAAAQADLARIGEAVSQSDVGQRLATKGLEQWHDIEGSQSFKDANYMVQPFIDHAHDRPFVDLVNDQARVYNETDPFSIIEDWSAKLQMNPVFGYGLSANLVRAGFIETAAVAVTFAEVGSRLDQLGSSPLGQQAMAGFEDCKAAWDAVAGSNDKAADIAKQLHQLGESLATTLNDTASDLHLPGAL